MAKHYKQFKLDPYTCWLRVYIDRGAFEKFTGEVTEGMGAATFRDNGLFAVFIPADESGCVNIRLAAHEAYHVADFLLEHVWMEYKHNSGNEHVADLVGHVCERIVEAAKALTKQIEDSEA